jgi:hypothetical protein
MSQAADAALQAGHTGAEPARIRKIAVEEHFIVPEFIPYLRATSGNISAELFARAVDRLAEFDGRRLEEMEKHRIEFRSSRRHLLHCGKPVVSTINWPSRSRASPTVSVDLAMSPCRIPGAPPTNLKGV